LKARKVAKNLCCKYTGTLGVIVRASKMGIIKNPSEIIEELKKNGFWIADEIVSKILNEAEK
jgi:predicted nucleic acid-binding protein